MICTVTISIRKPDGDALEGVTVSVLVRGSTSTNADSDANGTVTFSLTSGSNIKFLCDTVRSLNGQAHRIPFTSSYFIGTFAADAISEQEVADLPPGGAAFADITGDPLDNSALSDLFDTKAELNPSAVTRTASSFALGQADSGEFIRGNRASAQTCTLNSITTGFNIIYRQVGAGATTFVGGTDTTVVNRQSHTDTAGQHAVVSLICDEDGVVVLAGDTA